MSAHLHPLQIRALEVRARFFPPMPTRVVRLHLPKPPLAPPAPTVIAFQATPIITEYGPWIAPNRRGDGTFRLAPLMAVVREVAGVSLADLKSIRRDDKTARARQVFCWLARRFSHESFPSIGSHIGGRDHTTVLHAVRRVDGVVATIDPPDMNQPRAWAEALLAVKWPKGRPNLARRAA